MRETTQRSEAAAERPEHDHDGEHDDDHDAAAEARRAAWARLLAEAQRLFDAAPRFRIEFERDGTVSLREKAFRPCMDAPPEAATIWRIVSGHPTLEEAERRLRHITSPPVYYDARGQLARPPATGGDAAAR